MADRNVNVMHLLLSSLSNNDLVLLYPHGNWAVQDTPYLAMPTKKILPLASCKNPLGTKPLQETLNAILRDDLGLTISKPTWKKRLPAMSMEMCSPRSGEETTYNITSLVVPLEDELLEEARVRLKGRFVRPNQVLPFGGLSPTARLVFDQLRGVAKKKRVPDEWTSRLLAIKDGGYDGFVSLIDEARPWLTLKLRGNAYTRDLFSVAQDVEDALQEATLRAYTNLAAFHHDKGYAKGWLWIITRNCAINILRQRTGKRAFSTLEDDGKAFDVADDWNAMEHMEDDEVMAIARKMFEQVLAKVPEKMRVACTLRYREDLSLAEIAEEMGEEIATVGTWLYRFRQMLKGLKSEE
jgi:RNA polymerase sigma factor (sigma-70 family)